MLEDEDIKSVQKHGAAGSNDDDHHHQFASGFYLECAFLFF